MVRQRTLTPSFQGSNPCSPVSKTPVDDLSGFFVAYGRTTSRPKGGGYFGLSQISCKKFSVWADESKKALLRIFKMVSRNIRESLEAGLVE